METETPQAQRTSFQFSLSELILAVLCIGFLMGWITSCSSKSADLDEKDRQIKTARDECSAQLATQKKNYEDWAEDIRARRKRVHFTFWKVKQPDGSIMIVMKEAADGNDSNVIVHEIDPPLDEALPSHGGYNQDGRWLFRLEPSPRDGEDRVKK